jgi:N-acetylglucosamine-6-phosphate deacetylase
MAIALVNCRIFTGSTLLDDGALIIDGASVVDIVPPTTVADEVDVIDLSGAIVGPAFVDIQVNGGGGVLFNDDPSPTGLRAIAEAHADCGTLAFLPTLMSASPDKILAAAEAVRTAIRAGMSTVLGLHCEGPYISAPMKGAHDEKALRPLTEDEMRSILLPASDVLRVITVSPGMVSLRQLETLTDAGIVVLLGHSDATYEEATEFFERGASGVTHIFNAMPPFSGGQPGLVGAALAAQDAWVSVIADGHHVHPGSIRAVKQTKRERLLLITDAMPPLGSGDGAFPLGPHLVTCSDGRCTRPDGKLAGSALDMAGALRVSVERCGIPLEEAWRMASTYPAALLGRVDLGAVAPGTTADLAILDGQLRVKGIVERGTVRLGPRR